MTRGALRLVTMGSAMSTGRSSYVNEEVARAEVGRRVDAHLREVTRPRVLDAGCGRAGHLDVGADAYVLGIDVDAGEIQRNERLTERVVGDIQTCRVAPGSFDLALCWDVLEHLERPESALRNLRDALRPGGLLVLAVPNTRSLKALTAKWTPHWLHAFVWRQLYPGAEAAHEPFPTVLSREMSVRRLDRFARDGSMVIDLAVLYESRMQARLRSKLRITGRRWRAMAVALRTLTLGAVDPIHSDAVLVLRKR